MQFKKVLFLIVVSLLVVSCSKREYIKNKYLGRIPDIHAELLYCMSEEKQYDLIEYEIAIQNEWDSVQNMEIPCEITEGTPLRVIEPLHFTSYEINNAGKLFLSYKGKMIVTEDIRWDSTLSTKINQAGPFGQMQYTAIRGILGYMMLDGDTIYNTEPWLADTAKMKVPDAKKGYVDCYMTLLDCWTDPGYDQYSLEIFKNYIFMHNAYWDSFNKYSKQFYELGGAQREKKIYINYTGIPQIPLENHVFWNAGDTLYINSKVIISDYELNEKDEPTSSLAHFKGFRYTLAF